MSEKIRNICLLGHGSTGKTSLAESILNLTGMTDRLGKVVEGNSVCDFDAEEMETYSHNCMSPHYLAFLDAISSWTAPEWVFDTVERLPEIIEGRRKNWQLLRDSLAGCEDKLLLPQPQKNSKPSWFGFLITVKEGAGITRNELVAHLERNKIQTRMLFSGNVLRHPCFTNSGMIEGKDYRVVGDLKNTDSIMNNTFWLGVYPGMTVEMIECMAETIMKATGNNRS